MFVEHCADYFTILMSPLFQLMIRVRNKSSNIVNIQYAFETETKMCLVMDYIDGGDLYTLLNNVCSLVSLIHTTQM